MRRAVRIFLLSATGLIVLAFLFTLWRGILVDTPAGSLALGVGGLGYMPLGTPMEVHLLPHDPLTAGDFMRPPMYWRAAVGLFLQFPWWLIAGTWLGAAGISWRVTRQRASITPAFPVEK